MGPLWKTQLPGENPELAESLERAMGRVVPNPATAHWGMRGGFVKFKADAKLALQLAGNDLTLNGYDDDLARDDIQALLIRLADALAAAFRLPSNDLGKLRALATGKEPPEEQSVVDARPNEEDAVTEDTASPSHRDIGDEGADTLAKLVLELVALNRGLHTRLVGLEARVDALEARDGVEATLERAEKLAQALRRS